MNIMVLPFICLSNFPFMLPPYVYIDEGWRALCYYSTLERTPMLGFLIAAKKDQEDQEEEEAMVV
jgi:hypothetical protein